ncbi:uncharacterized protein BO97DRAFT_428970 [Aspergillus homomorphus CBS 101889]|uniref:Uncharacterized protein n=1 Tax=Aspergillus homomorphus (strain CBS 101889) TaxID=1450537 RepID=A0A395HJ15_ASPHC|nr:hypothetical protein BO97DRAFT_428970 [Aspergillus homomorphus CBS 101889]RAL07817.1 hypothetical protein BO97DRAFT_428970 [Aspergillus homomorphus CBS 101889]
MLDELDKSLLEQLQEKTEAQHADEQQVLESLRRFQERAPQVADQIKVADLLAKCRKNLEASGLLLEDMEKADDEQDSISWDQFAMEFYSNNVSDEEESLYHEVREYLAFLLKDIEQPVPATDATAQSEGEPEPTDEQGGDQH